YGFRTLLPLQRTGCGVGRPPAPASFTIRKDLAKLRFGGIIIDRVKTRRLGILRNHDPPFVYPVTPADEAEAVLDVGHHLRMDHRQRVEHSARRIPPLL